MTIARILAIAGSDSGGGAGIQADIKTITMLGGHALTAITAITAQNTRGVTQVMPVPAEMVLAQIDAVAGDIGFDAVKIGMLGSVAVADAVVGAIVGCHLRIPVVFDPVMVATSGSALADPATIDAYRGLMRRSHLVTPNLPELEVLVGETIAGETALVAAARRLADAHGCAVLAKGGHLDGPEVVDILVMPDGKETRWRDQRIETRHSHGTGCTLSSAIATGLGQGMALEDAIDRARRYVRAALAAAPGLGGGHGPMGHGLGRAHFT